MIALGMSFRAVVLLRLVLIDSTAIALRILYSVWYVRNREIQQVA
jgi:hypothetical protein